MDKEKQNTKPSKKTKKKGIIRTEALLPLAIVIGLLFVYFSYFFDNHLRKAIEFGGTYALRAEVNVGQLDMQWTKPGLFIGNVQVTNRDKPETNLVEVGRFELKLLWDALLRGKFVIPKASIAEIKIGTTRRRPGRVLPEKKSSGGKDSAVEKAADETIEQLKKENEKNFLSDLMALADGGDHKSQLKKLEGELKSSVRIKELQKELKEKEVAWNQQIEALPKESELKQLTDKIKTFKVNTSNPNEIKKSLKELDKLYKEAKAKYKTVSGAKKAFSNDIKKYKNTYKNLEKMVQSDIDSLAQKMNIPSLDPQQITKMLLGNLVGSQLQKIEKYKRMVREYMPAKKAAEEQSVLAPETRMVGRDFKFLKTKSYPKFWLKSALISSKATEGGFDGDIEGSVANITDSPQHLGLPATANIKGDFPHSKIAGLVADIVVDHTTDIPKESATISVDQFPVSRNTLTQSEDVELGYNKAIGKSNLKVNLEQGTMNIVSQTLFSEVDYFVGAKSSKAKEILTNITKELMGIDLQVRAKGPWDSLDMNIRSNLGQKIVDAIKGQVEAQIKKARADIKKHVQGLIGKERGKIDSEIAKIEKKLGISLKGKDDALQSAQSLVENKKKEAINSGKKKAEKKLKEKAGKELKKLKDKFKLKF